MAYPLATIYSLSDSGISQMAYDETEHVRVTRAFLNRTEMMLRELLDESATPTTSD
jgi:predicted ATPase